MLKKIKEWLAWPRNARIEIEWHRSLSETRRSILEGLIESHAQLWKDRNKLEDRTHELEDLVEDAYEEGALAATLGKDSWHTSDSKLRRSGGVPTRKEMISMAPQFDPYPQIERIEKIKRGDLSAMKPQPAH